MLRASRICLASVLLQISLSFADELVSTRQLQVPDEMPKLVKDPYVHTHYDFNVNRLGVQRRGQGELWFSFQDGGFRFRLQGVATSPRFGEGDITVVVDSAKQLLFVRVRLPDLNKDQCLKYPFPKASENQDRLDRLRWRELQVLQWSISEAISLDTDAKSKYLPMNWTETGKLSFWLSQDNSQLLGIDLTKDLTVVKSIRLHDAESSSHVPQDTDIFSQPSADCRFPSEFKTEMATVELSPPHERSSMLKDLLLMLTSHDPLKDWTHMYLFLAAITLPGDVAVMLDDPPSPHPERLGPIAFDYNATVAGQDGSTHYSAGSVWINTKERTFRLHGQAKNTKIGDLEVDIIAQAAQANRIYANVNLDAEAEHQCISYQYPTISNESALELEGASAVDFTFSSISQFKGEDCAVFIAPLARDRWIHLWVDVEANNPDAFMRTEIHYNGKVLRTTDIISWHSDSLIPVQLRPDPIWNCKPGKMMQGRFAYFDISEMHKKSIELQDALYSIHELPPAFALREVLGLTGDVAITIDVPTLPNPASNGTRTSVSFSYSTNLAPLGRGDTVQGTFAMSVGPGGGTIRATAYSRKDGLHVTLAMTDEGVGVKVQERNGAAHCLKLPLQADTASSVEPMADTYAGKFVSVEQVRGKFGSNLCNHFALPFTGGRYEHMDFWYSEVMQAACKMALSPKGTSDALSKIEIDFDSWKAGYTPDARVEEDFSGSPSDWPCESAQQRSDPWMSLQQTPVEAQVESQIPGVLALAKVGEALGISGFLTANFADRLSRLLIRSPSATKVESLTTVQPGTITDVDVKPKAPTVITDITSPDLKAFSFSFTSKYPLQPAGDDGHTVQSVWRATTDDRRQGRGEVHVDLQNGRFYMRSEAKNVSAGILAAESQVIYRSDQGRVWIRTIISDRKGQYDQCWTLSTMEVLPTSMSQKNPFQRGQRNGADFSVQGISALKYGYYLNKAQKVQFFVNQETAALVAVTLENLQSSKTAGVAISDWSTTDLDLGFRYDVDEAWKCGTSSRFVDYAQQLADWEFIKIFLPPDDARRLNLI